MIYENGGDRAKIKNGKWESDNKGMAEYLNMLSESFVKSGSYPDIDYALASWIVGIIGGKIIGKPKVDSDENRIY